MAILGPTFVILPVALSGFPGLYKDYRIELYIYVLWKLVVRIPLEYRTARRAEGRGKMCSERIWAVQFKDHVASATSPYAGHLVWLHEAPF